MTTIAGYLLAAHGHVLWRSLFGVVVGTTFVIASACVFNNILDRKIDEKMSRTAKRALVTGAINTRQALVYGTLLGILGFIILLLLTNNLTTLLGLIGYASYIAAYGYAKRHSIHGTLVGTLPGAMPLVSGYTAITNNFDSGALILFMIMVFWQMPHFYAIAIYRLKDYRSAGLPVMPVKKGVLTTKVQIMIYVVGFGVASIFLSQSGHASRVFAGVMCAVTLYWLYLGFNGWRTKDENKWARGMFGFSLLALLVMSVLLGVDSFLP